MSDTDDDDSGCYICNKNLKNEKWIGCITCNRWSHTKCASLTGIKEDNIKKVNWVCDNCKVEFITWKCNKNDLDDFRKLVHEGFKAVNDKVDSLSDNIGVMRDYVSCIGTAMEDVVTEKNVEGLSTSGHTWSEVVSKKKKKKSNLLVIASADENVKATDSKDEVSQALADIEINDSKFTKAGKIILNFKDETARDEAAVKLVNMDKVTTKKVDKLDPKIMICNVYPEEDKDKIVETLLKKNDFLNTVDNINDKIKVVHSKPASGTTFHYILKCHPEVRALIHKNNDKLLLQWGRYNVRDRYHALVCFHCQRYGHMESKCIAKQNNVSRTCPNCTGDHERRDCKAIEKKCINCVRFKKTIVNHRVDEMCCPVFAAELERIKANTDHGF